jgi:hypothetical protein
MGRGNLIIGLLILIAILGYLKISKSPIDMSAILAEGNDRHPVERKPKLASSETATRRPAATRVPG